jgi:hypothetical protein
MKVGTIISDFCVEKYLLGNIVLIVEGGSNTGLTMQWTCSVCSNIGRTGISSFEQYRNSTTLSLRSTIDRKSIRISIQEEKQSM